jgi:hypothetical protein
MSKCNPTQLISTQLISSHLEATQLNQQTPHTPLRPLRLPARSPTLFTEYSADIRAAGSPWGMEHGAWSMEHGAWGTGQG